MNSLEILEYVKENKLEDLLTKSAIFNEIGYNFTELIKGKIIKTKLGEYRVRLKEIGNVDLSLNGANIEDIENLRRKNKYLPVLIVKHGNTDLVLFPRKTDPESIADCLLIDFIEYAKIDSILILDHFIRKAKEIELFKFGIPKEEALETEEALPQA